MAAALRKARLAMKFLGPVLTAVVFVSPGGGKPHSGRTVDGTVRSGRVIAGGAKRVSGAGLLAGLRATLEMLETGRFGLRRGGVHAQGLLVEIARGGARP